MALTLINGGGQPPAPPPALNTTAIDLLEKVLVDLRSGKATDVALTVAYNDGTFTGASASVRSTYMIGTLEFLKMRILASMQGRV